MRSLIAFFAADWRLTKKHFTDFVQQVRHYHHFRTRGFTRRASWFNAANVL